MPKTTHPISYLYDVNGVEVEVTRYHTGTAYPVNGNVHNPTEYFRWAVKVGGQPHLSMLPSRAEAYEEGRAKVLGIRYWHDPKCSARCINVRPYWTVAAEMSENYRGRRAAA